MAASKRPGALNSDRAGDCVLGGTLPHTMRYHHLQHTRPPFRIVGWRVSRWLSVEAVEVKHG